MGAFTANLTVGAAILLTGISLVLAVTGFLAYRRVGHGRLLWVGIAFLGFVGQGITWLVHHAQGKQADLAPMLWSLVIVLALYVAVLRR